MLKYIGRRGVCFHFGDVPVSTGNMQLVKLFVCNALNGKIKYKRWRKFSIRCLRQLQTYKHSHLRICIDLCEKPYIQSFEYIDVLWSYSWLQFVVCLFLSGISTSNYNSRRTGNCFLDTGSTPVIST